MFGVTTYVESMEMLVNLAAVRELTENRGNVAEKSCHGKLSFTLEFGAVSVWLADTGCLLPFLFI